MFVQDSALSHRSNLVQDFLEKSLKHCFVKCVEWPRSSPDVNPLDYFFWDLVKTKVYQGRAGEPFISEKDLKTKIKAVWKDCGTDLKTLQKAIKQSVPRLRAVEEKQEYCIKVGITKPCTQLHPAPSTSNQLISASTQLSAKPSMLLEPKYCT